MRLEALARLIETADFMSFRELALECLRLRGYHEVTLTDGWRDGGTDIRVFQLPPNPAEIGFQLTVERDWRSKLHEDADKMKTRLGITDMTLVASRRIAESDFQAEAEVLWRDSKVRATRIDGQGIASTFFREGETTRVLELLGIDVSVRGSEVSRADARAEAAYAYVFFGKDPHTFRTATIEAAIVSEASRSGRPIERVALEQVVSDTLQLPPQQRNRVTAAIDRMIQEGALHGPETELSLSDLLLNAALAMRATKDAEWIALAKSVREFLVVRTPRKVVSDESLQAIMQELGALLLEHVRSAESAVRDKGGEQAAIVNSMRDRLRRLHANLDTIAFPEGHVRDIALEGLAQLASNSPVGKHLMAGELFLAFNAMSASGLIRALGARSHLSVVLDTSVAMPMLCALFYGSVDSRFSKAAEHVFQQMQRHDIKIVLPSDYLEEVATHLLNAYRDYRDVVTVDTDLVQSENAFVAHYAALAASGGGLAFADYLASFGFDKSLHKADYYIARDAVAPKLRRLFDRYSIETILVERSSSASRKKAETAVMFAAKELGMEGRPDILVNHDVTVLTRPCLRPSSMS